MHDPLPQARVLYHEAAGILGTPGASPLGAGGGASSSGAGSAAAAAAAPATEVACPAEQRSQLLREALQQAACATELAPDSLSCAALRATIAINLLIEESAAMGAPSVLALPAAAAAAMAAPTPAGEPSLILKRAAPGSNPPPITGNAALSLLQGIPRDAESSAAAAAADAKCEELRSMFADALAACSAVLALPQPALFEPVITLCGEDHTTWDPCCLAARERLPHHIKQSQWEALVQEKRAAVVALQGVLHSCHALLDSSQVPAEGVVRLLQHLLRCVALLPKG